MSLRQRISFAIAAAVVGGLLSAWILHRGMVLTPDSWAYWQGSVSLLDGRGYTYFYGDLPLKEWPPLYSCYLAAWQAVLGISGQTLILATVGLAISTIFGWTLLMLAPLGSEWQSDRASRKLVVATAISVFVAFFVAGHQYQLLSDHLLMALLPPFIGCTFQVHRSANPKRQILFAILAGVFSALLMLTHNRSVVYVAAGGCIAVFANPLQVLRIGAGIILAFLAIVPWIIVRRHLGQTSDHPMGWGNGTYSAVQYVQQFASGMGNLLGIRRIIGMPVLVLLLTLLIKALASGALAKPQSGKHLLFTSLSLLGLFALFNLIWLDAKLEGRFLWFAVLSLVSISILSTITFKSTWAVVLTALILSLGAVAQALWLSIPRGAIWRYSSDEHAFVIKPNVAIRRDVLYHETVHDGSRVIIAPPYYPWLDTLMQVKASTSRK